MSLEDSMKLAAIYRVEVKSLWNFLTKEKFNVLRVGTLFRQTGLKVIVGGEDGVIRIYDLAKGSSLGTAQLVLETKSGPILTMAVHDVTKFYHKDLIVGDSCGMLTVFCNQQILSRQQLSDNTINELQVQNDRTGNIAIVTSDEAGVVCAVQPSTKLWSVDLNSIALTKEPGEHIVIRSLLSVELSDTQGHISSYILATDNYQQIHVLQQGSVVMTIKAAGVVTAMCKGRFVSASVLGQQFLQNGNTSKEDTQVALGTGSGAIYLLQNFTISVDEYARTAQPITKLCSIHLPESETDLLLCAGYFSSLQVFQEGKKLAQYEMPDWIATMDTEDIDGDGIPEVVVGCMDNSIHGIKVATG